MIQPRLIHPIVIFVAQFDAVASAFDDKWHTKKQGTVFKYRGLDDSGKIVDENLLLQVRAQIRNTMIKFFEKQTGGWVRQSKVSFWVKSEDALIGGSDRFDKGDKIVKMRDLAGLTVVDLDLKIRDVIYRAPYQKFEFVELLCEKETAFV